MNRSLLMLVPPFALLVWRPEWTSAVALLGAMALLAWKDWRAAGHAMRAETAELHARVTQMELDADRRLRAVEARGPPDIEPALRRLKMAEEALERHAQALATVGRAKGHL